jgi:hypothetical protein
MKTWLFNSHACLIIWPALMLEALAASSQSARGFLKITLQHAKHCRRQNLQGMFYLTVVLRISVRILSAYYLRSFRVR